MYMSNDKRVAIRKPFEIRERLFLFACDVVDVAQKLHTRGPIAGSLSVQPRLRLRVLRATGFLEPSDDPLIQESNELRLIVATIIRNNARKDKKP